jgi:hypothetical protein
MRPRPPSSSSEAFFSVGGTRLGSHTSTTTSAPCRYTSRPMRYPGEPARVPAPAAATSGSERMSPAAAGRPPAPPQAVSHPAAPSAAGSSAPHASGPAPPAAFTAFVTSSLTTSSAVSCS